MSTENVPSRVLYQDLDTSFVNLWGLLRYLSQRSFIGRVHVELTDYAADVFLDGSETPLVHEIDRSAGTEVVEEAALHRLVLRVRESAGKISVHEGAAEAVAPQVQSSTKSPETLAAATPDAMRSSDANWERGRPRPHSYSDDAAAGEGARVPNRNDDDDAATETTLLQESTPTADTSETIKLGGELIAAIEHAATAQGANFAELFRQSRVALADDYAFLDPMSASIRYEKSSLSIQGETLPQGFVAGISEALRRVVDGFATGDRARRTRERVALEMARVARKHGDALVASGFKEHLDRIAGTKVI